MHVATLLYIESMSPIYSILSRLIMTNKPSETIIKEDLTLWLFFIPFQIILRKTAFHKHQGVPKARQKFPPKGRRKEKLNSICPRIVTLFTLVSKYPNIYRKMSIVTYFNFFKLRPVSMGNTNSKSNSKSKWILFMKVYLLFLLIHFPGFKYSFY